MKRIYFVFNIIVIAAISLISENQDVVVYLKAPSSVDAGKSFMVNVTFVKKSKIETFARFVVLLPNGMTAEPVESRNAVFSFKDREVKFLWLPGSLPMKDTFDVSFVIKVDTTVAGTVYLQSQFVYVKDNERRTFKLNPTEIMVNNAYGAVAENYTPGDTTMVVKNESSDNSQTTATIGNDVTGHGTVQEGIVRQIDIQGNVANITVTVNKKGVGGSFAKIEENLPAGFEAIATNDAGSVFTFTDNKAKFLWVNFPKDSLMTITYKVMKNDASDINPDELTIKGVFSYLDGTETKEIPVIDATPNSQNILAETQDNTQNGQNITETRNNEEHNTVKEETDNQSIAEEQKNTGTEQEQSYSEPEKNPVFFRVQICALSKKKRSIYYVKRVYKVKKKVYLEEHEGWRKYTTGKFVTYKSARDYRNFLWKRTPAKDAFITAYNNGSRVTVQEALMVANQKWIK